YASHSGQVEEVREALLSGLGELEPRAGELGFYSTVTGGRKATEELDGEYWYRNLRERVRLEAATRALLREGHGALVEVSPHGVLVGGLEETVASEGVEALVVGTLRR